jgi:hypothetical protein
MDMGVEYIAASSEGATDGIGLWSVWPVQGPFFLRKGDVIQIKEIADGKETPAPFADTDFAFIWKHALMMFDYTRMSASDRLQFQRELAKKILEKEEKPDDKLYAYFNNCYSDLPVFFNSERAAIDYFVSQESLTPWDEMSTDELEMWSETFDHFDVVAIANSQDRGGWS